MQDANSDLVVVLNVRGCLVVPTAGSYGQTKRSGGHASKKTLRERSAHSVQNTENSPVGDRRKVRINSTSLSYQIERNEWVTQKPSDIW
jgi:hypothetical protein